VDTTNISICSICGSYYYWFIDAERGYLQMKRECGFTVVEALVGMALIALILLFETNGRIWAMRENMQTRYMHNATMLAQLEVAKAYWQPFQFVVAGTTTTTYKVGAHTFTVQRTVTTDIPLIGTDTVHVDVTWDSGAYSTDTIIEGLRR